MVLLFRGWEFDDFAWSFIYGFGDSIRFGHNIFMNTFLDFLKILKVILDLIFNILLMKPRSCNI